MSFVNKLSIFIVIALVFSAITTVPSFATELNNNNSGNESSINGSESAGSSQPAAAASPKDAGSSAASATSSGCFSSDTLVTLTNQKQIPIEQLRPGDELLTSDGSTIFTTQMMMMLDKNTFSQAMFHTIVTASGHNVSLTEFHVMPINQNNNTINYIPAKQVKVGDLLYVMSNDQLVLSPVTNVTVEMKTGYYAPLTMSGTLLVNGIMASCYANVQSHEAAHFYIGPLRLYHWIAQSLSINEPFGHQNMEGVHFVPQLMYEVTQFLYPSALRFS